MPFKPLSGQVALVTGASHWQRNRLAAWRSRSRPPAKKEDVSKTLNLPTLWETAKEVTARRGQGIAVFCDHSDPDELKKLFKRIDKEQNGRLDILVNNAYAAVTLDGTKFYDMDPSIFEKVNNVGLKKHYICSVYGARLVIPRKRGLIVTVSSGGGLGYLFNTAYGVGKAACDRMAANMAHELTKSNVCFVSLWFGLVMTQLINHTLHNQYRAFFAPGETAEFAGKCVAALARDPEKTKKTGMILTSPWLVKKYGLVDVTGKIPTDPVMEAHEEYLKGVNEVRAPS
ncbi:hypothetical protein L596_009814 [Steinernema carpocapsae]|uniref:Uncharacterized protein n=1 Tax=Steinernema carpocapsae TaxID=34508 RepID=A0A4U5PGF9_STECR|nr:hypothetical protein L596_009814 [Steinernema carpocapsae]